VNIVLVNPEIPQNTGNIARTCAATGAKLHLIEPLGFKLEDKYLKRAGLDYWNLMTYRVYPDFETFLKENPGAVMHFATTKAPGDYTQAVYGPDDYLVFGCETRGLPENLLEKAYDRCEAFLAAAPTQAIPWHWLKAQLHFAKAQYAEAREHFEAAWEHDPKTCCSRLEDCCRELGDFAGAYFYACKLRELSR